MDMTLTLCTVDDLDELRKLSIQTYYETFAAVNTAKNMEEYLNRAFDREKLRRELENIHSKFFILRATKRQPLT